MRPGRDLPLHVLDPALEEGGDRHAGRVDVGAVLDLGQQPGALNLRLALGAREGMPTAFALSGLCITHIDDDGPTTGRPLPNMALHLFSPLAFSKASSRAIILSNFSFTASLTARAAISPSNISGTAVPDLSDHSSLSIISAFMER